MAFTVSVALCTHNGAQYLGEQIRSICTQTRAPQEIVLSDDASSDDCVAVARAAHSGCMANAPAHPIELRVLRNDPALRVTKNFERAALACRGDLIALCDQDDTWVPDRLARMVSQFERRPELLLLHSDARLVDAQGKDLGETLFGALEVQPVELARIHLGRAFDVFLRRNLVTGAATLLRRSLLDSAAPFPVEWLHDEWLGIVAAAIGQVEVMEEALIDYRQHGGNQIGARRDTFREKLHKALASRGDTHVRRAIKAELLMERLRALGPAVAPENLAKLGGKIEHQRFRAHLPPRRMARLLPVAREAMTGRYAKYGRGVRGVVRDLFEGV